jgi:glycosyltransferase involved in cell wall biosynthesis
LKILHVISGDLWAGAEMQAYTLMSNLRQLPGVEVAAAVMNDGELALRLQGIGVAVTVLDERVFGARRIVTELRALMRRWRPHVVHTHRTKENVLASIANRLGARVPSMRTVHGASEHSPRGLQARLRHGVIAGLDSWCARYAQERIIAVSAELAGKLAAIYPPEKIVVIANGVDAAAVLSQRQPAQFRDAAPEAVHVGIVGRLVPVKRVDLFLRAAQLLSYESRWRFHVFGDGPLRGELTALAESLGIANLVTFHGHRRDIVACMAALDVVVMSSDHEGLPMTALEATVLGVPLVAHAVGALLDVVPPAGLVQEHTAAGYSAGVLRMLAVDRESLAPFRARVLDDYSSSRNALNTLRVYEDVCARTSR